MGLWGQLSVQIPPSPLARWTCHLISVGLSFLICEVRYIHVSKVWHTVGPQQRSESLNPYHPEPHAVPTQPPPCLLLPRPAGSPSSSSVVPGRPCGLKSPQQSQRWPAPRSHWGTRPATFPLSSPQLRTAWLRASAGPAIAPEAGQRASQVAKSGTCSSRV